ncbi:MAG TPA: MarR family transcriptional regulator [Syntrophorhabdaceae bacterium]|nr:MarR family transcriptional regulator [Syntrophorhabdaceae bacterium]HOL06431.1 MarR family transcriptional regulator [Syntrophorhabdaceae bacterium]HON85437.1 MarR family transcriptional regulator [Syntrophorhabdaceae bacterium]HOT41442.1 MarR family transcriptional regulator [Syntrophorhabdaceae bacterium]HPC66869.1 MarR family transcriptional regulator [Syntrophorhabdaceae bacterium]
MADRIYKSDLTNQEKLLMAIIRVGESYKRIVSSVFRRYGLSFPQYNILRVLNASENKQAKTTTVSKIMLVPPANMTGLAKRLEKNGYILRKSDPNDERATILEITEKGMETLKNIEIDKNKCVKTILEGLTENEIDNLLRGMKMLLKKKIG